jgi:hypothetical protein
MKQEATSLFDEKDIIPSLREAADLAGLDVRQLTLGFPEKKPGADILDRRTLFVSDGDRLGNWFVPSLRALFRGHKVPPPLTRYPPEYVPIFHFIECGMLLVCESAPGLRDRQIEDIYSTIRRRPDGKSLGAVHDGVWQIAAMLLGLYPLSQAQFEGIFAQLAASCRHFQMGSTSRNYIAYLQEEIG